MRVSHVEIRLTAADLNELIAEFAPDIQLRIMDIQSDGLRGQIKLLLWNIDFIAQPSSRAEGDQVSIDVTAHKLIPIPGALVQRQLKEAIKDAPPGVEVLQQSIKVHVPSILKPFDASIQIREFACHSGYIAIVLDECRVQDVRRFFGGI